MKHYSGNFIESLASVFIISIVAVLFIPVFLQVRENQEKTKNMFHMKQQYQKEIESEYQDWKEELENIVKEK